MYPSPSSAGACEREAQLWVGLKLSSFVFVHLLFAFGDICVRRWVRAVSVVGLCGRGRFVWSVSAYPVSLEASVVGSWSVGRGRFVFQ
jgi:hypothetical protein